jgi:hypothetical protein
MADTNVRECKRCGYEGDCIEGVCFECSVSNSAPVKAVDVVINLLEGGR